jgi:hypothetical protein
MLGGMKKKEKFPVLSKLSRKILSILVASTSSEQLFSDAGNLLTVKRTRMKPERVMFLNIILQIFTLQLNNKELLLLML